MARLEETRSDTGDAIAFSYALAKSPAEVWRALTEPALIARWLMPAPDFRAEVGCRFTFQARPAPGWDGVVHCEVLAVERERLLRYSWRGGSAEIEGYGHPLDTVVTWTLAPGEGGATILGLRHAGFREQNAFALRAMRQGWSTTGASIERVLGALD